ncbi:MAG: hypothetical protein ABL909_01125 [Sphingopyxis sp.]
MIATQRLSGNIAASIGFGLTIACGLVLLAEGGASTLWLAVQSGAALVALTLFTPPLRRHLPHIAPALVLATPFTLVATLLLDPGLEGVHRWLNVGPMRLHIGLLLLPTLILIHARGDSRFAALSLIACAVVIGLQPDLGTALGLFLGQLPVVLWRRDRQDWLPLAASFAAVVLTFIRPDPLQP